jgi:hypothetical protein
MQHYNTVPFQHLSASIQYQVLLLEKYSARVIIDLKPSRTGRNPGAVN